MLELQSLREGAGRTYRVTRCWKDDGGAEVWPFLLYCLASPSCCHVNGLPVELQGDCQPCETPPFPRCRANESLCRQKAAAKATLVFLATSEEALEVYTHLRETLIRTGLWQSSSSPAQAQDLGSGPLQQVRCSFGPEAGADQPLIVCVCSL